MAFEFRGGVVFQRGPAEAAADIRNESPTRRGSFRDPTIPTRTQPKQQRSQHHHHHQQQPDIQPGRFGTRQGQKQTVPGRPMQLDLPPPPPLPADVVLGAIRRRFGWAAVSVTAAVNHRKENGEVSTEEEGEPGESGRWARGRPEVPALRDGQDAAVADGAHGPEDAVQRVWGPVQVRSARTRVPTSLEPDVRADEALQLASQGAGASAPEGDGEGAAAVYSPSTAAAASPPPPPPSEHGFRCIQRWRLLDSPTHGARLPAADLVGSVLE